MPTVSDADFDKLKDIPVGHDCQFGDGRPCPFLALHEYMGAAYCKIERSTPLGTTHRQTWQKTPTCRLRP